jgi:hypothetical protein
MSLLYVNKTLIPCDRHGNPETSAFCKALFPGDWDSVALAESLTPETHLTSIVDFLRTLSQKMHVSIAKLSKALHWEDKSRKKEESAPSAPPKWSSLSSSSDDSDLFSDEEEEEEEEEEETPERRRALFFTKTPKAPMKKSAPRKSRRGPLVFHPLQPRQLDFETRQLMFQRNTEAIMALGSLNAQGNGEFALEVKTAALPFIKAIKKLGPFHGTDSTDAPQKQPERANDNLYSVAQRIEQLGLDADLYNTSELGKRALQLYKERWPGCLPPQRVVVNKHGHEYLMNVYTLSVCRETVDKAIYE